MLLIKVNAIANLDSCTDKVLGFNIDKVRNLIILMTQVNSLNQIISGLRTTSRQFQTLQILVVVKQNGLRAADYLSFTTLGDNIYCITSPYINTYNAIQLSIQSNSARLSVGSATRNICLSFQICQSRSAGSSSCIGS